MIPYVPMILCGKPSMIPWNPPMIPLLPFQLDNFAFMKYFLTSLLGVIIFFTDCTSRSNTPPVTQRDTTITPANSFSDLFLDSTIIEKFLANQQLEDSSANRLRSFYNTRNYQFAWFNKDGLAEQARAFWNLHNNFIQLSNDSAFIDNQLHEQMELLVHDDTTISMDPKNIAEIELRLTEHFFEYAQYAYDGKVNPDELQWHIPRKKVNPMALLDSLVSNKGQNIEQWEPVSPQYALIKNKLMRYQEIEKAGGWGEIILKKKKTYKAGDTAVTIRQVKRRLYATGDLTVMDTSEIFTPELTSAVKLAQKRFGLHQDGIIKADLVDKLNIPVTDRIKQVLINMERMRWMLDEPEGNRILVNIPDYKLHVFENGKKIFDIDIVVGTAANKTVVNKDDLKYVVFSPYWNSPRSIVRKEILPAMAKNPNYLARNNMEQTGFSNGLPVIRQKPGNDNALGRVKFIFPNSFNIYFHDTPAKSLFDRQQRAFSHGCIRLAEPKKLAEYLLRNQPEWTTSKINQAMRASKEKWVTLNEAVPVLVTYFTAWVSGDGLLNFREDIYGHDQRLALHLFE